MPRSTRKEESTGDEVLGISDFKRRCLEILDRIHRRGGNLVITKRGEPIARVTPMRSGTSSLRGLLRGRLVIHGDIVHSSFADEWESGS